jgi:hypothetical protein
MNAEKAEQLAKDAVLPTVDVHKNNLYARHVGFVSDTGDHVVSVFSLVGPEHRTTFSEDVLVTQDGRVIRR